MSFRDYHECQLSSRSVPGSLPDPQGGSHCLSKTFGEFLLVSGVSGSLHRSQSAVSHSAGHSSQFTIPLGGTSRLDLGAEQKEARGRNSGALAIGMEAHSLLRYVPLLINNYSCKLLFFQWKLCPQLCQQDFWVDYGSPGSRQAVPCHCRKAWAAAVASEA